MATAAATASLSPALLPYRIAQGAEPETVDASFVMPVGSDLEHYIGQCWGFLVGSAELGDPAVGECLVRVGARKIERLGDPEHTGRGLFCNQTSQRWRQ